MTWAIVGATGQLGQTFAERLGSRGVALPRALADLTQPEKLRETLAALRPEVVVNCAAYNDVDRAESEPGAAFAVNAAGVASLARACAEMGAILVHFSTNYVFGRDRERRKPYTEADAPGPINLYGVSKLAGEHAAQARCSRCFIVRTAALFGGPLDDRAGSFVARMLRLARSGRPLKVVNDQIIQPTCTVDVVDATLRLVETERFGLYHVTCGGAVTWHDVAEAVFELAGVKADLQTISSAEYGAAATRPAYGVLANTAYAWLGLPLTRHWRVALEDYLRGRDLASRDLESR